MDNTLLAVFTGILAFAVLMQSVLFFLMYKSIRQLTAQIDGLSKDLLRHVGKVTASVEEAVASIKGIVETIRPVANKMADSADIVHQRVLDMNGFLGDVTDTAREEIAHIQDALHDATQRAHDAIGLLGENLLTPIHKINALARGIRVAFDVLCRRQKSSTRLPDQDDDIFI